MQAEQATLPQVGRRRATSRRNSKPGILAQDAQPLAAPPEAAESSSPGLASLADAALNGGVGLNALQLPPSQRAIKKQKTEGESNAASPAAASSAASPAAAAASSGRPTQGAVALWTEDQVAEFMARCVPSSKEYQQAIINWGLDGATLLATTAENTPATIISLFATMKPAVPLAVAARLFAEIKRMPA